MCISEIVRCSIYENKCYGAYMVRIEKVIDHRE